MFRISRAFVIVSMLVGASPSGFAQLRNISTYSEDQIHNDQTYFVLKDSNTAVFAWASEWTQGTVQTRRGSEAASYASKGKNYCE